MTEKDNLQIDPAEVQRDVDIMFWSIRLEAVKRFYHLRFWEEETRDSDYAEKVEFNPRLESVADHSWHVSDIIFGTGSDQIKYLILLT